MLKKKVSVYAKLMTKLKVKFMKVMNFTIFSFPTFQTIWALFNFLLWSKTNRQSHVCLSSLLRWNQPISNFISVSGSLPEQPESVHRTDLTRDGNRIFNIGDHLTQNIAMTIEHERWRWRSSLILLILLFTKPNIKVSGWLYHTKTHITHIVCQPFSKVTPLYFLDWNKYKQ